MGFVAELYYLLWVKKRISKRPTELSSIFCWKKSNSVRKNGTQEVTTIEINGHDQDLELGTNNGLLLKGFVEDDAESSSHQEDYSRKLEPYREDNAELELMRLHNLRFLFTIKEETKEDLESDDGKSRGDRSRKGSRTRSFSDLTLVLTPLSSPPVKSQSLDSYNNQEFNFNPLFESDINSLKSSPPPKFKFLRDAEEKLIRKVLRNGVNSVQDSVVKLPSSNSTELNEEKDGSLISFQQLPMHHYSSASA
ncbi:PREDICTED: uncharacterized protein LOC109227787 [Nicotiana attenuata]|uniref:Uncharacterized protein n=1 Tax=Nicotiana attenuata TaxID=49451 RepID=A0A1J6IBW9_NICAT|nr:PREDICTED: uncharacterized protein LOC109227787 [Nicotiana attenuata]OIT02066.1 hypothetical protein A4A49_17743 [Nicotiana attenuata]